MPRPTPLDITASIGLGLGGALGMAGTLVPGAEWRQALWAIDGVALVVAAALLTIKYARSGHDFVAAGFLTFVAGEALVLSDTAAGLAVSVASFAAGIAVWSAALLLISLPRLFPIWTRVTGCIAAAIFAVVAGRIFWGEQILPNATLPLLGYPFLALTFVGWIVTMLRPEGSEAEAKGSGAPAEAT